MRKILFLFALTSLMACKDDTPLAPTLNDYFPTGSDWSTRSPDELGWNTAQLSELYNLLETNGTRGFIVLQKGHIVLEQYWGKDILNVADFNQNSNWYWASAGKTLTSTLAGIAADEQYLDLYAQSNQYLGNGWSSLTPSQEDAITVRHHLTMTTGLDDGVVNVDDTDPSSLIYLAPAGQRWAYHNAPYTLIDTIIEAAVNQSFESYFNTKLRDPIGMDGNWLWVDHNHVYFSTPRSMARFGHLILHRGTWDGNAVIPADYVDSMTTRSQNINESYGFLWWLNNGESFMMPTTQAVFTGNITPHAPEDMVSGLGKNGQFVCVIPSKDLVVVRMGENPDNSLVPALFLEDIWEILGNIVP